MLSSKNHYRRPHHTVELLRFRNYTAQEILDLSVKQVTVCKTFDELGHPVPGGLYDPVFGPTDQMVHCDTCGLSGLQCPGHMGHIELPLPAFNPVFYQLTLMILRGSCLYCHRMMCGTSSLHGKLLLAQLHCLDLGYISLVKDLENIVNDTKGNGDVAGIEGAKLDLILKLEQLDNVDDFLKEYCKKNSLSLQLEPIDYSRNTVQLRNEIVREFLNKRLFKIRRQCELCKMRQPKYTNESGRAVLLNFSRGKGKGVGSQIPDPSIWRNESAEDVPIAEDPLEESLIDEYSSKTNSAVSFADPTKERNIDGDVTGPVDFQNSPIAEQLRDASVGKLDQLCWRGTEVREHFRTLWEHEGWFLERLFPMLESAPENLRSRQMSRRNNNDEIKIKTCPIDVLFFEILPVPPTRFRPVRFFNGQNFEDPQTAGLKSLLETIEIFRALVALVKGSQSKELMEFVRFRVKQGRDINQKFSFIYEQIQSKLNGLFDADSNKDIRGDKLPGLRQIIEKKEGLFRKHMMGKRVNFACRSVITPDPYLAVDEIGIPEVFAKRLTFTEYCSSFNVPLLRSLVKAGPDVHPGANFIISNFGQKRAIPSDPILRRGEAKLLHAPDPTKLHGGSKAVLRHLQNGDIMLMNRQPTLHKPSIMGHRARVLKHQKALRMNYAPCKAYNADFDGDEMNSHLVQSHVARAEAFELMSVRYNYLVPKDGTPILGLIQDHVISGVLLTIRNRFFDKEDYNHLVLSAFPETARKFKFLPPTIIRPARRWTGKQVLSTVILNVLPDDKPPLNLEGKAKTGLANWEVVGRGSPNKDMSESHVIIRSGQLLCGVLDKAHYGATPFGLIHCCHELYGPIISCNLLSCFSRLFTTYLQLHGFSLGVADILVARAADKKRTKIIRKLRQCGPEVVCSAFGMDPKTESTVLKRTVQIAHCNSKKDKGDVKQLDFAMKQATDHYNNEINKPCIPHGLIRLFPRNSLQLMIESGAKGTVVNAMQISCLLGQIELEGCRPPLNASGRSLPSFQSYDLSPRAGGFVDQRFMTGIKPQELFFHTMAGRDGLIDTAVKTSRSGYLQRCVIKHLEGLVVNYDLTVRDSDTSIIQFRYGEDGMEIGKVQFLDPKQYPFLHDNLKVATLGAVPSRKERKKWSALEAEKLYRKVRRYRNKQTKLGEVTRTGSKDKKEHDDQLERKSPTPVNHALNPQTSLGALPEKFLDDLDTFVNGLSNDVDDMKELIYWKSLRSLAEPGHNVGLLAAQSIGEPSTQMTLNTFHFAGRGEMNVTLGIPRLREILMTGTKNILTPMTQVPVKNGVPEEKVEEMRKKLDTIHLKQVLKKYTLQEVVSITHLEKFRQYKLTLHLLRAKDRDPTCRHLSRHQIIDRIEKAFAKTLGASLDKKHRDVVEQQELEHARARRNAPVAVDDTSGKTKKRSEDDDGHSSDEEGGVDLDAADTRLKQRHDDAAEYEGEEEEHKEVAPEQPEDEALLSGDEDENEDVDSEDDHPSTSTVKKEMNINRIQEVMRIAPLCVDYRYDANSERWCSITFQLSLRKSTLDVQTIVKRAIDRFLIQQTPAIQKCISRHESGKIFLQTQGSNMEAFFKFQDYLEVSQCYSNDIHLIAQTFGIEAAARAVIREVENVFGCYGIKVDKRHLSLLADYMTHTGTFQPFNRFYMKTSASPLQKMSFESTTQFLRDTMLNGEDDHLDSPSAALVVGQPMKGGTGAFDLLVNWKNVIGEETRKIKFKTTPRK